MPKMLTEKISVHRDIDLSLSSIRRLLSLHHNDVDTPTQPLIPPTPLVLREFCPQPLSPLTPKRAKKTLRDLALSMETNQSHLSSPKYLSNPVSPRKKSRATLFLDLEVLEDEPVSFCELDPIKEESAWTDIFPVHDDLLKKRHLKNSSSPQKSSSPARKAKHSLRALALHMELNQSRLSSPKYLSNPVSPRALSRDASLDQLETFDELTLFEEETNAPLEKQPQKLSYLRTEQKSRSVARIHQIHHQPNLVHKSSQPAVDSVFIKSSKSTYSFKRNQGVSNQQNLDSINTSPTTPPSKGKKTLRDLARHMDINQSRLSSPRYLSNPVSPRSASCSESFHALEEVLELESAAMFNLLESIENESPKTVKKKPQMSASDEKGPRSTPSVQYHANLRKSSQPNSDSKRTRSLKRNSGISKSSKAEEENKLKCSHRQKYDSPFEKPSRASSSPLIVRYKQLRLNKYKIDKELESIPEELESSPLAHQRLIEELDRNWSPENLSSSPFSLESPLRNYEPHILGAAAGSVTVGYKQLQSNKYKIEKELESIAEDLEEVEIKVNFRKSLDSFSGPIVVGYKQIHSDKFRISKELETIPEDLEELESILSPDQSMVVHPPSIHQSIIVAPPSMNQSMVVEPSSVQQSMVVEPSSVQQSMTVGPPSVYQSMTDEMTSVRNHESTTVSLQELERQEGTSLVDQSLNLTRQLNDIRITGNSRGVQLFLFCGRNFFPWLQKGAEEDS